MRRIRCGAQGVSFGSHFKISGQTEMKLANACFLCRFIDAVLLDRPSRVITATEKTVFEYEAHGEVDDMG